jgi:Zn-dependent metalloprotease
MIWASIIPPHILREIIQKGDREQREWALGVIEITEQFRGQRLTSLVFPLMTLIKSVGERRRTIYDAQHRWLLPGKRVRGEGEALVSDSAVNEAYDGRGATYDLYHDVYGRNSIDDAGMRLDATVHYRRAYPNAFWNGSQMVFGDGDGRIFEGFTKSIDVIAHELTHGVTQYESGLEYQDQSGALNESMSDVFGSLTKQYCLKQQVSEASWLIGADLLMPGIAGRALRSMKEPGTAYDDPILGKDPQPAHMKDYLETEDDHGGVHINCGIPNHAFYVAAIEIGGYAWEKAGQIWYEAQTGKKTGLRLHKRAQFQDAANFTFKIAGELYGKESLEQKAVKKGWDEVGISI